MQLGDAGLHSCIMWLIATLHSSIGSSVSSRVSVEAAAKLARRCTGVAEIVEGKLSSIAVAMSLSDCDIAALRITLHDIIDLVGRKHAIGGGSSPPRVGYSFFKHYVVALLLQGNIDLLENPGSSIPQHEHALQVRPWARCLVLASHSHACLTLLQVAQQAAAPLMVARASCFLLEVPPPPCAHVIQTM